MPNFAKIGATSRPCRPTAAARRVDFRARRTRRLPREDPRAEVGEEVRVGVGVRVGPVEFKLKATFVICHRPTTCTEVNNSCQSHISIKYVINDNIRPTVVIGSVVLIMISAACNGQTSGRTDGRTTHYARVRVCVER